MYRIDREHAGVISIEDLHLFFGDEISVGLRRNVHLQVNEIEAVIKQTFGCRKENLTENDLEKIMNTKVSYLISIVKQMIVNNNTEALAMYHSQSEGVNPDQTYITVGSIFSRVASEVSDSGSQSPTFDRSNGEDLLERSKALTVADRLANFSFRSSASRNDQVLIRIFHSWNEQPCHRFSFLSFQLSFQSYEQAIFISLHPTLFGLMNNQSSLVYSSSNSFHNNEQATMLVYSSSNTSQS